MNKAQFLNEIRRGLSQLPAGEIEKQLGYYSELIDDMMEDGMTEYEAVSRLGSVQEIYENILRDMPLPLLVKTRAKPKGGWTSLSIILIILGFPVWFTLAVGALIAIGSVYVVIWALVFAAFAVVLAIVLCAVVFGVLFVRLLFSSVAAAVLALGCAFVFAGIGIAAALVALACAKLIVKATAAIGRWIKSLFIRKES